jgi:hypothetical protein
MSENLSLSLAELRFHFGVHIWEVYRHDTMAFVGLG